MVLLWLRRLWAEGLGFLSFQVVVLVCFASWLQRSDLGRRWGIGLKLVNLLHIRDTGNGNAGKKWAATESEQKYVFLGPCRDRYVTGESVV